MRWWQIRKRNEDLERELRSDVELEKEEQCENGLSQEEARYAARRAFGNATLIREVLTAQCCKAKALQVTLDRVADVQREDFVAGRDGSAFLPTRM